MRNWFVPARTTEATSQALVATGALGGYGGLDPIDNDRGFVPVNQSAREQPRWTTEKERAYSIAAYRSNPMARAVVDTYSSFCVGDSGVSPQCDDPQIRAVVDAWWHDPKNRLPELQSLFFRDWMLMGEVVWEFMVGATTGVVRQSPVSPSRVTEVLLDRGNPLWPSGLRVDGRDDVLPIASIDDVTGLRTGQVGFWPSWRSLITDRRGTPFLAPILDDLDAYAQVLSNLIDRTSLARYLVWDVTLEGSDQDAIDAWVKNRGGLHIPRSGSVEVHNEKVKWEPQGASTGGFEDTNTAGAILTNIAGGGGLAKTWLAQPEGANRATSASMAEPVRRRVGGVQNDWLAILTEAARYAVDQAVAAGRLPRLVPMMDQSGIEVMVSPSKMVRVVGPEIAAADAKVTASVMVNLATAIDAMVTSGVMTIPAGALAVEKAWEQFTGRPFPQNLAAKGTVKLSPDATAEELDSATTEGRLFLLPTAGG